MNVDELVAIDVHVHVEISADGQRSLGAEMEAAKDRYFAGSGAAKRAADRGRPAKGGDTGDGRPPTIDQIADVYRQRRMAAVVFTVDAETATGQPPISNEEVAQNCAEHADVLIPFASIDPWKGKAAVRDARRLVTEHGVRGFKFHPSLQAFHPNDRMAYPLYAALEELRVPALFHTGQTGIGAGMPGGGGVRLSYSNPMAIDDVAVDFPHLPIILAHPSFPWQDEALAIATHKPGVFIDLSGWSPKYFPPQLIRYANSLLRHKMLFGSDYPAITPDRWLDDFAALDIKPDVRPLILKDNAARLLGLVPG